MRPATLLNREEFRQASGGTSLAMKLDVNPARRCVVSAIRLTLQALRDSVPHEVAFTLGARLPRHHRTDFFDGWPYVGVPRLETRADFLQRIGGPGDPDGPGEFLARAAFARIHAELSGSARAEVRRLLPVHLRTLWPDRRHRAPRDAARAPHWNATHLRLVSESRRAS